MAARTDLTPPGALRLGAVALGALLVAEGAVRLLGPRHRPIPPAKVREEDYFSVAELERAAQFRNGQRLIGLAALALEGGVLVAAALWRPPALRRALRAASRRPLVGAGAVGAGITLALGLARMPLAAAANARARRVGLSTQTFPAWLADQGRSAALGLALGALGGGAAVALARRLERRFWIGGALLVSAAAIVFSWLAPMVLAPLFNRFEPLPEGRLRSELLALAERAGVTITQVYRVDASRRSTALNAYVDGIGPSKRVVIFDNALRELRPPELASVLAHELAHVKGADVLRGLAFTALVAPLGLLFAQLAAEDLAGRGGDALPSPAGLPALALAAAASGLLLGVPASRLSRAIESRADAFALELTRQPQDFIELQKRLALSNVADPSPPRLLQFLLGTHPTTMQRIGAALSWANWPAGQ